MLKVPPEVPNVKLSNFTEHFKKLFKSINLVQEQPQLELGSNMGFIVLASKIKLAL